MHPIIEKPWEYELIALNWQQQPEDSSEPYVDLTFRKGPIVRRLRFLSPQNLRIGEGFPTTSGLCIEDISYRQLDGIRIEVRNFENSGGCPEFMARAVIEPSVAQTTTKK